MSFRPPPLPGRRAALLLLAASLGVLAASALGAARLTPPPTPAPLPDALPMPSPAAPATAPARLVQAALERDPFRPERSRPPERYRMPGEAEPAPLYAAYAPARVSQVQLQGVVQLPGRGGLAILWAPGRDPRAVRVGQSYEGFRLARIAEGSVVLVGADTTLTLHLREPTPSVAANAPAP